MLFPKDASNLILPVRLATDGETPITGVAYNSASLSVGYRLDGSSGSSFTSPTLVDGTLGTYIANSWKEIGSGLYQYCPPNAVVVSGGITVLKIVYGSNQPRFDSLEFRLPSYTSTAVTQDDIDQIVSGVLAAGVGLYNAVRGDTLTIRIADEFEQRIENLGDLTGNDDIVFAVQEKAGVDDDTKARISISRVNGLTVLNGAVVADSTMGSITVVDAATGVITVRLSSAATSSLVAADRVDCVKVIKSGGNDRTARSGKTAVLPAVIKRRG